MATNDLGRRPRKFIAVSPATHRRLVRLAGVLAARNSERTSIEASIKAALDAAEAGRPLEIEMAPEETAPEAAQAQ